jgi:hypothetical protein
MYQNIYQDFRKWYANSRYSLKSVCFFRVAPSFHSQSALYFLSRYVTKVQENSRAEPVRPFLIPQFGRIVQVEVSVSSLCSLLSII